MQLRFVLVFLQVACKMQLLLQEGGDQEDKKPFEKQEWPLQVKKRNGEVHVLGTTGTFQGSQLSGTT